jgi:hypothetical protein
MSAPKAMAVDEASVAPENCPAYQFRPRPNLTIRCIEKA